MNLFVVTKTAHVKRDAVMDAEYWYSTDTFQKIIHLLKEVAFKYLNWSSELSKVREKVVIYFSLPSFSHVKVYISPFKKFCLLRILAFLNNFQKKF